MSSYSSDEGREIKEGTAVSEKIEEKDTTRIEGPRRRGRRPKEEQPKEVAKPAQPPAATVPKRLLDRIEKHDTDLVDIRKELKLLNRSLKKLTTRLNRAESKLSKMRQGAATKRRKSTGSSRGRKRRSK